MWHLWQSRTVTLSLGKLGPGGAELSHFSALLGKPSPVRAELLHCRNLSLEQWCKLLGLWWLCGIPWLPTARIPFHLSHNTHTYLLGYNHLQNVFSPYIWSQHKLIWSYKNNLTKIDKTEVKEFRAKLTFLPLHWNLMEECVLFNDNVMFSIQTLSYTSQSIPPLYWLIGNYFWVSEELALLLWLTSLIISFPKTR